MPTIPPRTAARIVKLRRQVVDLDEQAHTLRTFLEKLDARAAALIEHALRHFSPKRDAVAANLRDIDGRLSALSREIAALRAGALTDQTPVPGRPGKER